MKTILSFLILALSATSVLAQKETFDLITYKARVNWTKENVGSAMSYVSIDKQKKSWCTTQLLPPERKKKNQ